MRNEATVEFFETSDVAREFECSAEYVRALIRAGRLTPIGTTQRGTAIFDPVQVRRLAAERRGAK